MVEFTASHFNDLCNQGPIQSQIQTIEGSRKAALSKFWLYVLGGLGGGLVLGLIGGSAFNSAVGVVLFIVVLVGVSIFAWLPLAKTSESIKHPVLHSLAAQGGMTFVPHGFDPPVFAEAHQPLFGSWLSSAAFSDLFYGQDPDGHRFAFYEATLMRGHGKSRHQVFTGQIYAFQRRRSQQGAVVAVPDRGFFNFWKPSGGFERVKFENDPAFEQKFEIYATDPAEAMLLFGDASTRHLLIQLRDTGSRVLGYIGPQDALIAVWGKNRFEPGSMFKSLGGQERVRLMFDDVCASLQVLNGLRGLFS
jgi:hypothetical protein